MMNHFLVSGGISAFSAACSEAGSLGDSAAGDAAARASDWSSGGCSASSQTNCSSSAIFSHLLGESVLHSANGAGEHGIHNPEISGERKNGKDDDRGRALHLLSVGPGHAFHFELQLRNVIP